MRDSNNGGVVTMKATVILAHPYKESFNHAIFSTAVETLKANNCSVFSHDLYAENFDPVLTVSELGKKPTDDTLVQQYADELIDSDILVFVHPNWWGMPPAILTGYIDRVLRPPHSYDFPEDDSGGGLPIGKLTGKKCIVLNTSNTEADRENNDFGDPLENIWIKCVCGFCGIAEEDTERKMFRIIADSSADERADWLKDVQNIISRLCCS